MTGQLATDFELTANAPANARAWLGALADEIDEEVFSDLRLLVSELVANSVRHSGEAHGAITVSVRTDRPEHVSVEVRDPGSGFEFTVPVRDPSRPSGLGLYILDRLVDRWTVSEHGPTRVWFEINRRV